MGRLNAESMQASMQALSKNGTLTSWNGEEMWGLGLAPTINSLLMKTGDSGGSNPSEHTFFGNHHPPGPKMVVNQKTCETNNQRFSICKNQPTNETRTSMTQMLVSWSWGSARYLVPDAFKAFTLGCSLMQIL